MSTFEKHQSIPERIYKSTISMMIISVINTAFIICLINFHIDYDFKIPILKGSYTEFSVQWYRLVGSSICVSMCIMIISPHFSNFCFQYLLYMK